MIFRLLAELKSISLFLAEAVGQNTKEKQKLKVGQFALASCDKKGKICEDGMNNIKIYSAAKQKEDLLV